MLRLRAEMGDVLSEYASEKQLCQITELLGQGWRVLCGLE